MRLLTIDDLPHIIELQRAVAAELPEGYIRPKTESDLRAYLDGPLGAAYGVVQADDLLAMSLLRIPNERNPNCASVPFPLVPRDDWPLRACFVESTMVLPGARGRGFQRALLSARLLHAASAQMRWICAGVHLGNTVSWTNLLAKGMAIVGTRSEAGYPVIGLLRGVGELALASDSSDRVSAKAHDSGVVQAVLDDGYIGVRMASDGAVVFHRWLPGLQERIPTVARHAAQCAAREALRSAA